MKRNDDALAPEIGVIFMVIITIVIAATVAAFITGMANQNAHDIGAVSITATNTDAGIVVTNNGGKDSLHLDHVYITVNGRERKEWVGGNIPGASKILSAGDGIKQGSNYIFVLGEFDSDSIFLNYRNILLTTYIYI